jgi:hypothetical protein
MRSQWLSPLLCLCWLLATPSRAAYYQGSYFVNECCQALLNLGLSIEEANTEYEQVFDQSFLGRCKLCPAGMFRSRRLARPPRLSRQTESGAQVLVQLPVHGMLGGPHAIS